MKSLSERLKMHYEIYKKNVELELLLEKQLKKLKPIIGNIPITTDIFLDNLHIYLKDISPEYFESEIISDLSDIFDIKWTRTVDTNGIDYQASKEIKCGTYLNISVFTTTKDQCRIKAVPTGEVEEVEKIVIVKEPKFKYIVVCGEED